MYILGNCFDLLFSLLVPGPVRNLQLEEVEGYHAVLKWDPPDEPNGLLLGYNLGYQKGERSRSGQDF